MSRFDSDGDFALALDSADELADFAKAFERPHGPAGEPARYLCGHSLGLMPTAGSTFTGASPGRWRTCSVPTPVKSSR